MEKNSKAFIEPGSFDFTLVALATLEDRLSKLERKVKRLRVKNSLYFGLSTLLAYCVYATISEELKEKEKKEQTK